MQYANGYVFAPPYARMYSPRMKSLLTVGDRLDKAMELAKIPSQSALARASGVPQATISRILKGGGKKGPETETLRKLAAACSVTFDWLNEGIGEPSRTSKPAQAAPQKRLDAANDPEVTADEVLELINAYRSASINDRSMLMSSAKAAAKRAMSRKGRTRTDKR
jgi:transcriptional regulator with XRE-family HTH domain